MAKGSRNFKIDRYSSEYLDYCKKKYHARSYSEAIRCIKRDLEGGKNEKTFNWKV